MIGIIGIIVILILLGIIFVSGKPFEKRRTREQFLQTMVEFLEGSLEAMDEEGLDNSYRVRFFYKGEQCVFEGIEQQGFKNKIYVGHLKIKTPSTLTLTLSERKPNMRIKSDVFMASEISTLSGDQKVHLDIPKHLKDLNIFTNDITSVNKLFQDRKIASLFKEFKNLDSRGYPFISLMVIQGEVILEFASERQFRPNIPALEDDIAIIEDYLDKMLLIVHLLKNLR